MLILRCHWHLWLILRSHHVLTHIRGHSRCHAWSHAHSGCHLLRHALIHTWRRHLRLHHLWNHTGSHSWIISRCNHSRVVTRSTSHTTAWRGHSLSRRWHHRGSTIGIWWLVESCEVHGCWLRNILRNGSIRTTNTSRRWNALAKAVSSKRLTRFMRRLVLDVSLFSEVNHAQDNLTVLGLFKVDVGCDLF